MAHGKKYRDAANRYDRELLHTLSEAMDLSKSLSTATFDESVELVVRLGIDPKKADQAIRGTVALPSGTGKNVRVAVFAEGAAAAAATEAGAELVGSDDLATAVEGGQINFDIAIATPDQMPKVGKLGRVLGPRGLMPNPKTGTVTDDVAKAVAEFKGGRVEYRADKNGNVQVPVGKVSFTSADLTSNAGAVVEELNRVKPPSSKGRYLKKVSISSTMGPAIKVDPARIESELEAD